MNPSLLAWFVTMACLCALVSFFNAGVIVISALTNAPNEGRLHKAYVIGTTCLSATVFWTALAWLVLG